MVDDGEKYVPYLVDGSRRMNLTVALLEWTWKIYQPPRYISVHLPPLYYSEQKLSFSKFKKSPSPCHDEKFEHFFGRPQRKTRLLYVEVWTMLDIHERRNLQTCVNTRLDYRQSVDRKGVNMSAMKLCPGQVPSNTHFMDRGKTCPLSRTVFRYSIDLVRVDDQIDRQGSDSPRLSWSIRVQEEEHKNMN